MQRGVDDFRAAEGDGIELGHRGDGASASDVGVDSAHDGLRGLGGVFESHDPARGLGGGAELLLLLAPVDLDHDAVDLEVEIVPVLAPFFDEGDDFVERRAETACG